MQALENHLVDVFLPRVPHVDELADQRHAGGRQLGLAQQWDVAGFKHVPRLIGGRHQPRARPLAVVEIDPGPVGDVRRGVVNLVRADQSAVDHRRVGVPRGRWQQPPIGTGAADLRRAAGVRHFDLRPQPGALAGRVAVPAGAAPAAALRGRAVVIRPHRDHVAPWAQRGGDVVGVVGLEPGIASGRPPAQVRAVHVQHVAVRRRHVQPRGRRRAVNRHGPARVEIEVVGLGFALDPNPLPDRPSGRCLRALQCLRHGPALMRRRAGCAVSYQNLRAPATARRRRPPPCVL